MELSVRYLLLAKAKTCAIYELKLTGNLFVRPIEIVLTRHVMLLHVLFLRQIIMLLQYIEIYYNIDIYIYIIYVYIFI